jgi:L-fuconolactonase
MVDFPIVDTHLHLWDPKYLRYPWLDAIALLNKPYLLADYRRACGPVQVEKMVFLQCEVEFSQFQEEADWVTLLAQKEDARIAGLVPWAPLELGDGARPALEKLAANPLVKGIRRIIQFEPDPQFCLRPDFVRGVQALPAYGLHFEICIDYTQFANTIKLVQQCPNVTFILDHIGKPNIKDHVLEPWKQEMVLLAELPNVWCKMSGLVTEADHKHWTREDLRPYIDHVLDTFGFDRTMYGGDWPVAYQAAEYPRWVETLAWAVAGCTDAEQRKLFRENALKFYRLA